MVIALVLILGGGPSGGRYDEYWGARTWYVPILQTKLHLEQSQRLNLDLSLVLDTCHCSLI